MIQIDNLSFRFPDLLEKPINDRIDAAKEKAQTQLEDILNLYGSVVPLSLNQNRKRRQTANDLALSLANVNSITALNKPYGSETFLVTFEYVPL